MDMFGAVWKFYFFSHLMFLFVTKFCVLACLIIWMAYKQFLFILTVALWNVFFPSEIVLCI